jgi:hypothetical protein
MPTAPPHPCNHPGCNALIPRGERYCPTHQDDRLAAGRAYDKTRRISDPNLSESMRIRRGAPWRKTSEQMRARNPFCCDPFKEHGPVVRATQVHHVFPLGSRPDLAYSEPHLRCVCTHCHALLERAEARGEETFRFFGFDAGPAKGGDAGFAS